MPRYKPDSVKHMFHSFLVGMENDQGEIRAYCPICEDPATSSSPSASFNPEKGVWACRSHDGGGSIDKLVAEMKKTGFNPRSERLKGLHKDPVASWEKRATNESRKHTESRRYKATGDSLPSEEEIADWNKRLLGSPSALAAMTGERGLTVDTINEWCIGWDGDRYMIPVRDVDGTLSNVRRYKLKAHANSDKMLNIPGYGTARLFRPDILRDNQVIVLAEGEMDCIILNQIGIPAITHTAGAATWRDVWAPEFAGKIVYVCYDNDDPGKEGALKSGRSIARFAEEVWIVSIPIPIKGADVSDYIVKEGHSKEEFLSLLERAEKIPNNAVHIREPPSAKGEKVSIEDSMAEHWQDKVLEMTVTVSGKQNPPYYAPKEIHVKCDMSKGPVCTNCPVFAATGDMTIGLHPDDKQLFRFLEVNEDREHKLLKEMSGARCSDHVEFKTLSQYTMEELILSNSIDDRDPGEDQAPIIRRIYSIGTHKTPVNTTVHVVGRNVADPKSHRQSFMAWGNESTQTSLDSYEMTEQGRYDMLSFQPTGEESPLDRCKAIGNDLAYNVTHIYGRDMLHVAYDLVWHSPLSFQVDGRMIDKGWLEMMVIGDTRTGKSETAIMLAKHYGAGTVKSCEGATFAGLVGGVQQLGGHWTTTWGIIPLNDRRLVVLDEVSGLKDRDVIENMSSIRSSGRAQITKIAVEETSARTRLIWITNPGDGGMINDKPDAGIEAIRTVVKNQEDIARFDFVMAATAQEVDSNLINSYHPKNEIDHVYNSELCQSLVLWAWSRKPDQIKFTRAAVRRGMSEASKIGERYVPDPPLLQAENARFKLYRIAAAIAARTFSTQDGETLLVTDDHIISAVEFLDEIYNFEGMGYARRSRRTILAHNEATNRKMAAKAYLLMYPDTVLQALRSVGGTTFRARDFTDFGQMQAPDVGVTVKKLLEWKMVHRKTRGDMIMDTVLVEILREIEDDEEREE